MVMHDVLIYSHAAGGLAAFVTGCFILRPRDNVPFFGFNLYFVTLWVVVIMLLIVVLWDWSSLSGINRLVFGGLTLLAFYTGFRGWQARQAILLRKSNWKEKYIDHTGFTLISLFDGFIIVSAIDLKMPGWLVGAAGMLGIITGILIINRVKDRYLS